MAIRHILLLFDVYFVYRKWREEEKNNKTYATQCLILAIIERCMSAYSFEHFVCLFLFGSGSMSVWIFSFMTCSSMASRRLYLNRKGVWMEIKYILFINLTSVWIKWRDSREHWTDIIEVELSRFWNVFVYLCILLLLLGYYCYCPLACFILWLYMYVCRP